MTVIYINTVKFNLLTFKYCKFPLSHQHKYKQMLDKICSDSCAFLKVSCKIVIFFVNKELFHKIASEEKHEI